MNSILVRGLNSSWFNPELLKRDVYNNKIACKKILDSNDTSVDDKYRARITLHVLNALVQDVPSFGGRAFEATTFGVPFSIPNALSPRCVSWLELLRVMFKQFNGELKYK